MDLKMMMVHPWRFPNSPRACKKLQPEEAEGEEPGWVNFPKKAEFSPKRLGWGRSYETQLIFTIGQLRSNAHHETGPLAKLVGVRGAEEQQGPEIASCPGGGEEPGPHLAELKGGRGEEGQQGLEKADCLG